MKNSGFTLIELLAVIVILAIIALIATPIVLGIIDDTKKSAMLRSAEFYLDGVENAVMRENMNSGGNFRPNECSISNGNMTCGSTDVEVEVDGEVPSIGSITFENGKITQVTLNYESGTIVKDASGNLIYEGSENNGPEVTITPKKETYTIGEEVEIEGEHFYVIADDANKVTLLTKDCIDTTNLVQSVNADRPVFSSTNYWSNETEYPLNLNDYLIPEGITTSSITAAKEYGIKVGGTGRLMTYDEATTLVSAISDIINGTNGKSSSSYLMFWLGSAHSVSGVWAIYGEMNIGFMRGDIEGVAGIPCCTRPVVEISKSNIS